MKHLKILSISLMSILLLSSSAFASEMNINKDDLTKENNIHREVTIRSSFINDDKGGWGEFGSGNIHAWAKYTHPSKTHRVVLKVDNSYHYGAYELAGPQNYSYKSALKGDSVNGFGEVI